VAAQESAPLAVGGQLRSTGQDFLNWRAVAAGQRHIQARHQRKMEVHVHFIAAAKVMDDVLRPLVGFGKKQNARFVLVHKGAQTLKEEVRFRQVFAVGALAFEQVGRGIHADAVRALVNPELDGLQHGFLHSRVVVVQVRLVLEEAVPEILLANRVVSPIGLFAIHEDDAGVLIFLVCIAPDVIVPVFFVLRMSGIT